jgi:hypothetical protein
VDLHPDLDGGVAVRRSYHLAAPPGRGLLVRLLIGPMWRQYMSQRLAASIREAERVAHRNVLGGLSLGTGIRPRRRRVHQPPRRRRSLFTSY